MKIRYAVIDIETTGLNRYKDKITWIGVGLYEDIGYKMHKGYCYDASKPESIQKFKNLCDKLRQKKIKIVWQGGKFDTLFLEYHYGIKLALSEDVMLMGTAYDLAARHGLKLMAMAYLGVKDWDIPKKQKLSGDAKTVVPYLKLDVKYTWELFCYFMKRMSEQQLKIYRDLLRPAYLMYRKAERRGVYIDLKQLEVVKKKYKDEEQKQLKLLQKRYDINWNSSEQKQVVLFQKEKLPVIKLSQKTGKPSADKKVLKRLAAQGHELPQLILEYTAANTLNKMFLNRWGTDASYDGRIHPSFKLTDVVTGRTSCSDPNLQQVPRKKDVRMLYTAPKKRVFFEADYSQLELRIAAEYAKEPTMLRIFREDGDIHTETARTLTAGREPTKEERNDAKAVNFGFIYGMLEGGFIDYAYDSYGTVFTRPQAKLARDAFFAKYSRLLPWHDEMEELCTALGGVSTMFGHFRALPDIYSNKKYLRLGARRRAINTPVQGTGSQILLGAAVQVDKELASEGVEIGGTIHDSIVGELWEEDVEWFVPEIQRIMAKPHILDEFNIKLKVPLKADVGIGPWGSK